MEITNSVKRYMTVFILFWRQQLKKLEVKYIQGRANEKWEVEVAFGVCPDRVGSSEQP